MSFIDTYAQSCLPADTLHCIIPPGARFSDDLPTFFDIRTANLKQDGTKLYKLKGYKDIPTPPLRILTALTYALKDAWKCDRFGLIVSTVSSVALMALGVITKLTVGLMPLTLAMIIAGIAISVLKNPLTPRLEAIWRRHEMKIWYTYVKEEVPLPVKDEKTLLNRDAVGGGWEDPITYQEISLATLKTSKVIVVNNYAYFLSTILNTFLTCESNNPDYFIDPLTNKALEKNERNRVFSELSTIFCFQSASLRRVWEPVRLDHSTGESISAQRHRKFQLFTGYTTLQLEEFEQAAVQASKQRASVRPTP